MTSHLLAWLLLKRQETTYVFKDVEKREHFYTVGGNVNWYNHYRKQYIGSLKKLKIELHMIQQFHFWKFFKGQEGRQDGL